MGHSTCRQLLQRFLWYLPYFYQKYEFQLNVLVSLIMAPPGLNWKQYGISRSCAATIRGRSRISPWGHQDPPLGGGAGREGM